MATREQIVAAARSYLGVRWHHTGRSRGGIDCVGLVVLVARDCGINLKDTRAYSRGPQVTDFLEAIRSQSDGARLGEYRPGQVAIMRQNIFPMHVGIIAKSVSFGWTIIHAAAECRGVTEQPLVVAAGNIIELREFQGIEN